MPLDLAAADGDGGESDLVMMDLVMGPPCGMGNCQPGEVCELGACHRDCGMALRCGVPETCCAGGDVCYLGACTTPGQACAGGGVDGGACASSACPDGQYCEQSIGRCLPLAMTMKCEYHPPVGAFAPKVKWEWQGSEVLPDYNQVMMTPMVADLDGDCMPDVVFSTFNLGGNYTSDGVLRAVRGDGSGELWTVTDPTLRVIPGAQIALADVDGDGKVEVFACHETDNRLSTPGHLMALNFDGTKRWLSTETPCLWDAPAVADVNHDGKPEVVVGFSIFDAATGKLLAKPQQEIQHGYLSTPAELDGDDKDGMEIVGGGLVYHADGSLYWDKTQAQGGIGYPAVGDLDGDGAPDVVAVVPATHTVWAWKHDGSPIWGPKDVNNGVATPEGPSGGGPPTIADFNGDGKPDVATAGGYGYLVLDGQTGAVLWQDTNTVDRSSRVTGSSVFDFEGDGPAEAVYNDEHNLRVYRGADGHVLVKQCSTSGTLWENPVIVDVDGDDHAEIVVMDNNYAFTTCDQDVGGGASHTGFKVLGDAQNRWVRTRRIWNQHTYHVTNVGDDGRVPTSEASNWTQSGLNNFRQNVQTHNLFAAPDLLPRDLHADTDQCAMGVITLVATVLDQGAAGVPAGVPVTFYFVGQNAVTPIATVKLGSQILPGASEVVSFDWTPPMGVDVHGPLTVFVVVDDDGTGQPSGLLHECDTTNNGSAPIAVGCPQIG